MLRTLIPRVAVPASLMALALVGCGSSNEASKSSSVATTGEASTSATPVSNACPADGCRITITGAARRGKEIAVTWKANFVPDISRNHIHVYWDIYTADQVSSDAESRGVTQGEWVPTDVVPTYVTGGAVSVSKRGGSTRICATAGDRDHAVINSSLVSCRDVSDLL